MLKAEHISCAYDSREALSDVSLSLGSGDLIGVIGPNGSGKSTLIKTLSGIMHPREGRVVLDDKALHHFSQRRIAEHIAVVPQTTSIIFPYTVLEVVLMGRYVHASGTLFDSRRDIEIAGEALEKVDAGHFADRYYNQLSGGEQQLVIIARALAQRTPIFLLDEPSSALDLKHQSFIARLLTALATVENKTILIAGHNINYLAAFCTTLVVLKHGRIVTSGTPRNIISPELISDVYETPVNILHDKNGTPLITLAQ